MNKKILTAAVLCVGFAATLAAIDFKQQGDTLAFKTKRMEVKVRNARIISIRNLQNNVAVADPVNNAPAKLGGVGNMNGNPKQMSNTHFPWGEPNLNQHVRVTNTVKKGISIYRFPDAESKLTVKKDGKFVKLVWSNLTNGQKRFPNDRIEMDVFEDENGAFASINRASTADRGIFGLQIPIENFNGSGTFILPSFGGLKYKASGADQLITFQDTGLFYEAKFMAYEYNNTSLGYWYEDSTARPYYIMFGKEKTASSFGIEINNLMPFEAHNKISTPVMKIDCFANSDWIAAATPYRNFYQKTFAEDIKRRESIAWANKIYAIADSGVGSDEALNHVKKFFKPEHVLLHVWQARKLGFTTNIPDYQLRDAYPGEVARAHKHGFKVMCYVCSLCAVYKSPQWEKDNVGSFFLTRKNNINNYHGNENAFDENLVGTLTAARGKDQFGHLKPGAFLYGDPLSAGWRNYFVNICKTIKEQSGTDAYYQDTLGCTSENGNGIVDGLSGAQGNSALARALAKGLPTTPMASEFGPEPIAFAVKWPLNYPQVWGNVRFRRYRMHNQVPLSVYLFGYRTWIPTINAGDDFHKHLLVACSDGSGGLGMFSAVKGIDTKAGFADHMVLRSKIFTDNELEPYYPARFPKNITAMFKTKTGEIFSYYDDGTFQKMMDGKGKALYGRVDNVTSIMTKDLKLPGWPCADENGIYGLNPKNSYALFPVDAVPAEISFGKLADGVQLRYFYSTPDYAYIEFNGKGTLNTSVKYPARFKEMYVNNKLCSGNTISAELPVRIFFTNGKAFEAKETLRVGNSDGLQHGKASPLHKLKRYHANQILHYLHGFNSVFMDSVFDVKNADDAVEIYLRNVQEKYGNGTIISVYINGIEKAKFDCTSWQHTRDKGKNKKKTVWDTKLRKWTFPVGEYKGKRILFSVRVDNKASNNADMQFASTPRMVKQAEQKFTETFPSLKNTRPAKPAKKYVIVRPAGKPDQVVNIAVKGQNEGVVFPKEVKRLNTAVISGFMNIDPNSRYVLTGKFRNTFAKPKTFYYGIIQYDKNMRQIYGGHVNVVKGTESRLSHGVKKGATKLMVRDASQWLIGGYAGFGEMPCRDQFGPVVNTEQYGGDWGVYLKNPVTRDIESDTVVAQYRPAATHQYVYSGRPGKDFTEFGKEIKFFKGAVKFQIMMLGQTPVEFKDLKLEIYKAPAKDK